MITLWGLSEGGGLSKSPYNHLDSEAHILENQYVTEKEIGDLLTAKTVFQARTHFAGAARAS